MKLFIRRTAKNIDAILEYNPKTNTYKLLKGSKVSEHVSCSPKFRSSDSIIKARSNGVVENGVLTQDVTFNSASTAANFVTGTSTNGKLAWKDSRGIMLKELQEKEN